ncbi:hypothetical protein HJD18_05300 [Thermoleophilia bacterium SCSIO 60948]|nr:hypothetical protein HJD18_05300 [Thermoleophilia bacterium SCSIO 60948]
MGTFTERTLRFLRSNAVALLALFVALGGSAYAAAKIGSSDIKRNAVESRHIGKNEVRVADVASLPRAELTANSSQSFSDAAENVEFDDARVSRGLRLLTNGDSVLVKQPGVYAITGELHWESNSDGARVAELRIDPAAGDSRYVSSDVRPANPATNTTNQIATTVELGRNEIVSLDAGQQSGDELTLADFSGFSARMTIQYVSPPPRG